MTKNQFITEQAVLPGDLVTKRDLRRDEAIRPGAEPVDILPGRTLVFRRADVSPLRSRTAWSKLGYLVKDNEEEARVLSAHFGRWVRYAAFGDWQVVPKRDAKKGRAAAAKAVETKRKRLLEVVEQVEIEVLGYPTRDVVEAAIEHYNDRAWQRGSDFGASKTSDPWFLERITRNFIRHELTDYDCIIAEELAGRVGVSEAVDALRDRVNQAIDKAHPDLSQVIWSLTGDEQEVPPTNEAG